MEKQRGGQKELQEKVLETGLCTNCGACVNLCPYFSSYKDRAILIDPCDRQEGRCYSFCPRTPTDLEALRHQWFDPADITAEVGSLKGFYLTRATDENVRKASQHGGTVTTLVSLAVEECLIEAAILTGGRNDLLAEGTIAQTDAEVRRGGKSKFVASPTLGTFHQAAKGQIGKIGVVATPCQALALAKMRLSQFPAKDNSVDKLRLVIGLFCGWALSGRDLKEFLEKRFSGRSILGLDIPPSKHQSMEVHTPTGIIEVALKEVLPAVRTSCSYCFDLTCEFSDISVGSARLPEGWEVARGWNQVIVRTPTGQRLLEAALSKGLLECREVPKGNLERLKKASADKKKRAIKNLIDLSGSQRDLLYLDTGDPELRTRMGE